MPYAPFQERFPKIADKETRAMTILNNPELPSDTYGLIEAYCDELDCDCRRVFLNVISTNQKKNYWRQLPSVGKAKNIMPNGWGTMIQKR
jgi:hypothetical protein